MGSKKPNAPNAKRTLYVSMADADITAKIVEGIDSVRIVVLGASARLAAGIPYVRMTARNIGASFAVKNVIME
jgi:orotate phosphoribosyltransferase-like protein